MDVNQKELKEQNQRGYESVLTINSLLLVHLELKRCSFWFETGRGLG